MAFDFSQSYKQTVALLDTKGRFFLSPQTCKTYILDALTAFFYPEYAELWSVWNPTSGTKKKAVGPNIDRPEFIIWTGIKSREKNAAKFTRFINMLEGMIGVEDRTEVIVPDTGISKNSGPFIARAPGFWLRSPVTVSAYLLFMRLSIRLKKNENWNGFIKRMLNKKLCNYTEAAYVRQASKRGNIKGLLEQTLPCLHREHFSDYLLHSSGRGFAWYHPESDAILPTDEKSLKILRINGREAELNRMNEEDK